MEEKLIRKSVGKYPDLSVKNDIWSQALHSGTKGFIFKIHIIFAISLSIFKTHSIAQNSFGRVGGGGKSGKVTVEDSVIEEVPSNSIIGKVGEIFSRFIFTFGVFGKYKFGKVGNNMGLRLNWKSGKLIDKLALILCKSTIISGHFENCITGIFGIIILIILKIQ